MLCLRKFFWSILFISCRVVACDVVDDTGNTIHIAHPAKRIISLSPDLTETLFAIGAGSKIVGVMQGSDYPDAAKTIPVVANYAAVSREALLRLHPDLIVAWKGSPINDLQKILGPSVPIYVSDPHALQDIPNTMQKLSCLTGANSNGPARKFLQQLHALQIMHHRSATVFFEIWHQPLITINHTSWIDEVIRLCGGAPIFSTAKSASPTISMEALLRNDPEIIITTKNVDAWNAWPMLRAVKNKKVFYINPDWLERAGPRLMWGARVVCASITA